MDLEEGEVSHQKLQLSVSKQKLKSQSINLLHSHSSTSRKYNNKPHLILSSNYKKINCEHYNKGSCYRQDCMFSHEFQPQCKRKICKFYLTNCCKKDLCKFSHSTKQYPCKFYYLDQNCTAGIQCRFAHSKVKDDVWDEFIKDNIDYMNLLEESNKIIKQKAINSIKSVEEIYKNQLQQNPQGYKFIQSNIKNDTDIFRKNKTLKDPRLKSKAQTKIKEKNNCSVFADDNIKKKYQRALQELMFSYY